MKPRNKAANVITAILAALLSVLLVLVLFATGLVAAANSVTSPVTVRNLITTVVKEVDFEQIIIGSAQDNDISEEDLAQARTITALMESPAAEEFFTLYAQDVAATLNGTYDPANAAITEQTILRLANTYIDEMVDIVGQLEPEEDRETIRRELLTYVEENAAQLLNSVKIENLINVEELSELTNTLQMLQTVLWVLVGICLVLAGLIYACRYYRFGALIWLGVDTGIVALMILAVSRIISMPMVLQMVADDSTASVMAGMLTAVGNLLLTVALILLGITMLLIGLFILLKQTVLKKWDSSASVEEATL
ncbi:MAG: hypothetical protein IIX28_05280 [Clostridia bacterium]|nr:hypothetical protein [Clostridia bacterium]